jgi:hypothetical protein
MTTTSPPRRSTASLGVRVVRQVVTAAALLALYFLVPVPDTPRRTVVTALVFLGGLTALVTYVLVLVRRARTPDDALKIESLLLLLYAVVVFFSLVYLRLAQTPGEMVGLSTRIDAIYFTITTMATVGFGDISAAGQAARVVVTIHMVFNVGVLGVAARLIGSAVVGRRTGGSLG